MYPHMLLALGLTKHLIKMHDYSDDEADAFFLAYISRKPPPKAMDEKEGGRKIGGTSGVEPSKRRTSIHTKEERASFMPEQSEEVV